jgi:hypothetical protein
MKHKYQVENTRWLYATQPRAKKRNAQHPLASKVLVVEWYQEKKHGMQRKWNRIRNGLDQSGKKSGITRTARQKTRSNKENEPDAKSIDIKSQNSPVS